VKTNTANACFRGNSPHYMDGQPTAVGVEEQLKKGLATRRAIQADSTVKNYVIMAMGLGLVPAPLFDIVALIAIQFTMLHRLTTQYEVPFRKDINKTAVVILLSGSIPVLSIVVLSRFANLIPGIGSLPGSAGVSILSGALTYTVGWFFIQRFESRRIISLLPKFSEVMSRMHTSNSDPDLQDSSTKENQKTNTSAEELLSDGLASQRVTKAESTVKNHVITAMGLGLVPIPVFDLAALSATQLNMLHSLTRQYEVPFTKDLGKTAIVSLIGSAIPVISVIGLSSFAKLIPGIGSLAGSAGVSLLSGALTYAVGRVFIQHFESGGTLLSFNAREMRKFFKREFAAGKKFAKDLGGKAKASEA